MNLFLAQYALIKMRKKETSQPSLLLCFTLLGGQLKENQIAEMKLLLSTFASFVSSTRSDGQIEKGQLQKLN
jgi:hypothetical protein